MKNLNWIIKLVTGLALTFIVACSKPNSAPNGPAKPAAPGKGADQPFVGTGDGGGGNTCKGRPIESYSLDLKNLNSFKTYIQPIYNDLAAYNDDVYRLLTFVMNTKSWYLIPCALEKLPDSKIGSAVKTEQAAIQTFNEVWNYKPIVAKMADADQAKLFWHEIFMGIKLLRFESSYNQCRAFAPDLNLCEGNSKERQGKPNDLTAEDYADVRKAAAEILNLPRPTSQREWHDFLGRNNFSFAQRKFVRTGEISQVTGRDLWNYMQKSEALGFMPQVGHAVDGETGSVTAEKCSFKVQGHGTDRMILEITRENGDVLTAETDLDGQFVINNTDQLGGSLRFLSMGVSSSKALRRGERSYSINFYFDQDLLFAVGLVETACHSERIDGAGKASCSGYGSPANAKSYLCARKRIPDEDVR